MPTAKLRFTYTAPRWAKVEGFVKQTALWFGIDCKIAITKGWIRESGTIVCEGEEMAVRGFKLKFDRAMSEYNGL